MHRLDEAEAAVAELRVRGGIPSYVRAKIAFFPFWYKGTWRMYSSNLHDVSHCMWGIKFDTNFSAIAICRPLYREFAPIIQSRFDFNVHEDYLTIAICHRYVNRDFSLPIYEARFSIYVLANCLPIAI